MPTYNRNIWHLDIQYQDTKNANALWSDSAKREGAPTISRRSAHDFVALFALGGYGPGISTDSLVPEGLVFDT